MKRILVPVDFSKPSTAALDMAFSIAKKSGATIIVVHIVEGASTDSFKISGEGLPNDLQEKLYNYKLLQRSQEMLNGLVLSKRYSSVRMDGELRMGNVFHGIQQIIQKRKIDLVVMGVKGYSGWEEMLIGSNTEKVMRCAPVPVLTVHSKEPKLNFKHIVYATTMLEKEYLFPPVLRKIQQLYKSKIHFVYINTPGDFQADHEILTHMEKFAGKMKLDNYDLNVYNDFTVGEGVVHFANSINAGMVAMASRGRQGLARLIFGSVAKDVMDHFKKPTLTYVIK